MTGGGLKDGSAGLGVNDNSDGAQAERAVGRRDRRRRRLRDGEEGWDAVKP